ncbi:MAG: hypothetical protein KDB90_10965 [Planctomycetes bacterium]|nr:hypothetical protein [Planctomycetota bacterium]
MRVLETLRVVVARSLYELCLIMLLAFAGCATTGNTAATGGEDARLDDGYPLWDGNGLKYVTTRPSNFKPGAGAGEVADITLLDLDSDTAEQLMGILGPTDIAPRSFSSAMGEIAAVNASWGHGTLLDRPRVDVEFGSETPYVWKRELIYLQDWHASRDGDLSPLFDELTEGVDGKLTFSKAGDGVSIKADFASSQVVQPVADVAVELVPGKGVKIQVPELVVVQRVATETILPGETAVFQLSRSAHDDGTRIRLLFVRLRSSDD